ncbi:MAG: AMP-dependent synthetase/ligase [Deltaproteobacteria bacterium]
MGVNTKYKPFYQSVKINNLKEMLNSSCNDYASKSAFLVKDKESHEYVPILYSQLKHDVDALGTVLINLGLKGKRIVIIGENRYEWAVSYLAVVNGVGISVPLDKELPENEIESLIKRSEANAIIFSGKYEHVITKVVEKNEDIKIMVCMDSKEGEKTFHTFQELISEGKKLLADGDDRFINAEIDNEAMSIMLFTSGTTAAAKAVMLSHKNICTNIMDMTKMLYFDSNDTVLSFLPLNHTYECSCGFLTPLAKGLTIAYCEGLRHIAKNLKESKATIMLSVPLIVETMYRKIWEQSSKRPGLVTKMKIALLVSNLLKFFGIDISRKIFKDLHETFGGKLRLIISGAAALDPRVAKGFRDFGIHFIQGYGLTECSPIIALNMDKYFKDSAAGLPMPSNEIKIEKDSGNKYGEILAKGPNLMLGYYENPEATAEVIKDGWFYTGDLGYFDRKGFLHITGRKKDLIVTKNGKNIFPEELEIIINRSPLIKESMIFGKPDNDGDTVVCATIVINKEYINEKFGDEVSDGLIKSLIDKEVRVVNKRIPLYKHIREYNIREEEFKKTTTNKIKRYIEMAGEMASKFINSGHHN